MPEKRSIATGKRARKRKPATIEGRDLDLPSELTTHFRGIRERFANPIVAMRKGVCLGCFMSASSSQRQQIEKKGGYDVCEFCGRIVYYEEA